MRKITGSRAATCALTLVVALGLVALVGCAAKPKPVEDEATVTEEAEPEPEEIVDPNADSEEGPGDGTEDEVDELGPAAGQLSDGAIWVVSKVTGSSKMGEQQSQWTAEYTYDEHGNMVSLTTSDGAQETCTYDESGYLLTDEYTAEGQTVTTTFTYDRDDAGQVVTRTADDGTTTTWEYYDTGNIASITSTFAAAQIDPSTPEGAAAVTDEEAQNTTTTYYDETGLPTRGEAEWSDGSTQLIAYEYEFDGDSKATSCTSTSQSGPASSVTNKTYTYDANGNLIRVVTKTENNTETLDIEWQQIAEPSLYAQLYSRLMSY